MKIPFLLPCAFFLGLGLLRADTRPVPSSSRGPLKIVIKADDLKVSKSGTMPAAWERFLEIITRRKIKASIGIICTSLEGNTPKYFDWIQKAHSSGLVEFWFHGYDHQSYTGADNQQHAEFAGDRIYEDFKWRFERSEQLAKEKLGFPLQTFGPPGGGIPERENPNLARIVQEVPEMKVWLYPRPMDDSGRAIMAQGKVTILDRVWAVNIEQPLFVPNAQKLIAGLAKYPHREYFVIQGHPAHWKEEGFVEFEKMLDFLSAQGAEFVTPSECARVVNKPVTPEVAKP